MSNVTNVVIATSLNESEDYLIERFNSYITHGTPFNIVSIDNDNLPKGWYGGSKMFEANLFIGAFDYLDLDELLKFSREEIIWKSPSSVQFFVKKQGDKNFRLIDLFMA